MSDETTSTVEPTSAAPSKPTHRGGWQKGRPRKVGPMRTSVATSRPQPKTEQPAWKRKYGRTDLDIDEFATPFQDRLTIDPQLVQDLERENVSLQWFTASVMGQPQPHNLSAAERNGWQRVLPDEIPGIDITECDGMVLMARPRQLHRRALEQENVRAREQLRTKEQSWRGGDMNATGARHPAAVRSNRINRTMERIDVPGAERERDRNGRYR